MPVWRGRDVRGEGAGARGEHGGFRDVDDCSRGPRRVECASRGRVALYRIGVGVGVVPRASHIRIVTAAGTRGRVGVCVCARAARRGGARRGDTTHQVTGVIRVGQRVGTPSHTEAPSRERDGLTRGAAGDGRVEIRARAHVHAGMRVLGRSRAAAAADVDVDVIVAALVVLVFIAAIARIVTVIGVDELEPGVDPDAVCGAPGEQGSDAR